MSNFAHLHTHSEFSMLDGLTRLPTLVKRLQEIDQGACAITDHGEVSGHYKFYNEMIKNDVKPILGLEGYFAEDRKEKIGKKGEYNDHICLLAKNNEGLRNLWVLSSYAWLEGMHYNPRMDWELLEKYSNGVIATSGCMSGIVARLLRDEEPRADHEKAVERIGRLLNIFGDDFYLEIHTFDAEEQKTLNKRLVDLGSQFGVPLVAVSDSHYTFYEDWEDHEAITAMSMGKSYNDPDRFQYGPDQLRVFSEDDVRQRLEYLGSDVADEAVKNAGLFANQCEVKLESEDSTPMFYSDIDLDARELKKLAYDGFVKKIQDKVDDEAKYSERLLYEIEVIENKQFSGYFLLVADIVRWAKQNGLIVGPGRGSAGGSLLSYCLDITEIDPIKFDLIFERFLNPDRDAMPDIDLDLPKDERYLVRQYLEEKYGKDCVATIGTFSRWAPKSVMRDAARYFKMPINEADSLAKVIDDVWRVDFEVDDINEGWNQLFEENRSEFKYWENKYPQVIQFMNRHVGHIRHAGGHAAGVVLAKESLIGRLPLRLAKNDIRTQMEDEDVESMGFLKVDLLGLRTLSTIIRAFNMVKDRHGDIIHHPNDWQYHWDRYYEDASVFESIANARNTGIFQLETAPMQGATKRVRPGNIDDIATILAIVRPGITRSTDPESGLNLLELYLRKREGKMPVVYKDDRLQPILENSYGSFVFQEQIMQLANQLAGYSLSETDARVRKPIGKKKKAQVEAEKPNFIQGLIDNSGFDESTAESVFSEIEAHGQYSFNRAHSYGYALISYWCAYFKYHFTPEFMTALFQTNPKMTSVYLRECRRLGISVLPPDVNESGEEFTLTQNNDIRFGLRDIKWVGGSAKIIMDNGPYQSIDELYYSVPRKIINKRVFEALACVGALNSIVTNAGDFPPEWPIEKIALHQYWTLRSKDVDDDEFEEYCEGLNIDDRTACEMYYLDALVSHDPMKPYVHLIDHEDNFVGEDNMFTNERSRLAGVITNRKDLKTKRGKNPGRAMCQLWVEPVNLVEHNESGDSEDESKQAEELQLVAFPDVFSQYDQYIQPGAPVLCDVQKLEKGGLSVKTLFRLDKLEEEIQQLEGDIQGDTQNA